MRKLIFAAFFAITLMLGTNTAQATDYWATTVDNGIVSIDYYVDSEQTYIKNDMLYLYCKGVKNGHAFQFLKFRYPRSGNLAVVIYDNGTKKNLGRDMLEYKCYVKACEILGVHL